MVRKSRSDGQLARVAANFGIGVAGLVVVRLIIQGLPMFKDAGWIVKGKMTVVAGAVILVDAVLLSLLVAFALQLRACLCARFAQVPGLGTMAASLVFLLAAGIAYADFKPVTRAWPSLQQVYLWSFFALAVALLVQLMILLYQNRDRFAALLLRQPLPAAPIHGDSNADDPAVLAR